VGFSIVSYLLRVNITIAGEPIMHEFHLSPVRLGLVFSAFLFTYTGFMTPSGAWADRLGPRRILAGAGLSWAAITILMAYLPGTRFSSATGLLGTFLGLRLLLGVCESPTYTGAAKAIAHWVPRSERAFSNAVVITGALLGSAVTAPLISWLMVHFGWRHAMMFSSFAAPVLVLGWWLYATDRPQEHPGVNASELEIIEGDGSRRRPPRPRPGGWKIIVRSAQAWRLFALYGCQCYLGYIIIWWCYIYLVEVRKFSLVGGGVATAAPFILGTIATPAAGALNDRMTVRLGHRRGRIIMPIVALTAAAVLAFVGVRVQNAWLAVLLLSVGAALSWANEGPVWAAMMEIAAPVAGAAGGFLNTGGNFGGALAALLTPWIAKEVGWNGAFGVAGLCSLVGAALWLGFDPTHPIVSLDGDRAVPAKDL